MQMNSKNLVAVVLILFIVNLEMPSNRAWAGFPSASDIFGPIVKELATIYLSTVITSNSTTNGLDRLDKQLRQSQGNKAFDDILESQKKQAETAQQQITQNQETAIAALANYSPTVPECDQATSAIIAESNHAAIQNAALTIINNDTAILSSGLPRGTTPTAYRQQTLTAMKNKTTAQNAACFFDGGVDSGILANESDARANCKNPADFNTSLGNRLAYALASSVPLRAPAFKTYSPEVVNYIHDYQVWSAARSQNLKKAQRVLPRMLTSMANYNQALELYDNAFGTNQVPCSLPAVSVNANALGASSIPSSNMAASYCNLVHEFPNANNIGMSEYELKQARLTELTASSGKTAVTGLNPAQINRSAQQENSLRAELASMRDDEHEYEAAITALQNPAPGIPPGQ